MVASSRKFQVLLFIAVVALSGLLFSIDKRYQALPPALTPWHKPAPVWLIATISAAHSQQRRNIIRATWQTLFPDPSITTKFVIANPEELWMPLILHENTTYGDLIVLPELEENAHVANTIKSIEFFRHLARQGETWKFVSKIDDDSFLDVPEFRKEFLAPHLVDPRLNRTLIARNLYHHDPDYIYPGGQFYTLTWDLVKLLASIYTANPIDNEFEDVLVGRLLYEANETFTFVALDNRRAFDLDPNNENDHAGSHKVMEGSLNPHKMKDDETYLQVAAQYDRYGLKRSQEHENVHRTRR